MTNRFDSLTAELADRAAAGLRRQLRAIRGTGPYVEIAGRRVSNFSSNDYLGLAGHPALAAAAAEAGAHSAGSTGSRLISGTTALHLELESQLAAWLQADRALLFNSGYQANVGAVSALARAGDAVFSDALNHASLIDGCRLSKAAVHVFPHADLSALSHLLRVHRAPRRIIICESLFSMDGDVADLRGLRALADEHDALLLIDEAHALGACGPYGRGLGARAVADLTIGTFGKAFGSFGAFVAGAEPVVELVLQKARSFVFSTAIPPSLVGAAIEALGIIRGTDGDARRARLAQRVAELRARRAGAAHHIQPIAAPGGDSAKALELSHQLLAVGFFVQAVRPPTVPSGSARLRATLMSEHSSAQIAALAEELTMFHVER